MKADNRHRPSAEEFFELFRLAASSWTVSQWPKEEHARALKISSYSPPPIYGHEITKRLGLLSLAQAPSEAEVAWARSVLSGSLLCERALTELKAQIEAHPAYRWLRQRPSFSELQKAVDRKAQRPKPGKYGGPFCWFSMIDGVAISLGQYEKHKAGPYKRRPKVDSLRKAITALKSLGACAADGASVWPPSSPLGPKIESLAEATARLERQLASGKRAYDGRYAAESAATSFYASCCEFQFGEVSPTVVKAFAALVNYPDTAADQLLRRLRADRNGK